MMYKATYKKTAFRVKKPIRSFRDLEVYQSTSQYATEIMTKIIPLLEENSPPHQLAKNNMDNPNWCGGSPIKDKLIDCCLKIPELIATSHSHRFETGDELKMLDGALELCNKAVVYLEQARDIYVLAIEGRAACEDLIKRYILIRRKIFNLYRAWKKFQQPIPLRKWNGF